MIAPPTGAAECAAFEDLEWELTAPHTLEDIAKRLGVSKQTVCNIEAAALAKLRGLLAVSGQADWCEGLREPTSLHRAPGDVHSSDGRTPRRGGKR